MKSATFVCMLKSFKPAVIFEVLIHILFWAFITILPFMSRSYTDMPHRFFLPWHFVLVNVLLAIQFYVNAFFLIPVVLKRNVGVYFFLLISLFTILDLIIIHTRPPNPPFFMRYGHGGPPPPFGFNLMPLAAITAASFAYRYLAEQFKIINNKSDIANAALVSELGFLRSQISPHFIFNVINSLAALSRLNPVLVEPTLIQFSKLMRYMLYINDKDHVTLQQKEDYLRSYIDLQQLRFRDVVKVNFHFKIDSPQKTIEPMLLIPFVENAFKHGIGDVANPFIDITLLTNDNILVFMIENAYNPNDLNKDESHGIGLNNVKRRLQLLYPQTHRLLIEDSNNIYKVNLQIHLK